MVKLMLEGFCEKLGIPYKSRTKFFALVRILTLSEVAMSGMYVNKMSTTHINFGESTDLITGKV